MKLKKRNSKYAEIGGRIRFLRGQKTQSEFIDLFPNLRLTQEHLSRLERGVTKPKQGFIQAICSHFNKTKNWIIYGEDSPSPELILKQNLKKHTGENIKLEDLDLEKFLISEIIKLIFEKEFIFKGKITKKRLVITREEIQQKIQEALFR